MDAAVISFGNKSNPAITETNTATTTTATTNMFCGSSCVNTTISTSSRLAFYSFDNTTSDATGNYSMSGIASPNYVRGWIGSAINFSYNNTQFLSTSHIPLNSRSFTIDFWFYATDVSSTLDFSFGGEMQSSSNSKCLFMNIRNKVLYFGFYSADTAGITNISINQWYHTAFVYDNSTKRQSIYLNGILEKSSILNKAFLANNGSFTIGGAYIGGGAAPIVYYSGYIDHFTISSRIKSPCEIYLAATLACYFRFDSISLLIDSGPNFLTATNTDALATAAGRVNQALQFSSILSYVTINGISVLSSTNNAFTISMWIKPTSVTGGATLIHASTQPDGKGDCLAMWGLTSTGLMTVNIIDMSNNTVTMTTSSALTFNTWTHIAQVFSSISGNSLYINGTLVASVGTVTRRPAGPYTILGASPANTSYCKAGSISMGQFSGSIDEYYVFGRALTTIDICRLANP
ncbi:unnamed protein product [Adineta steineri]|uniref:LamG-like jellyroll fold domain-containing protein n=1 Tax=Adineta steineri TaxID=433720 RepID=A0A819J5E8_9BILA|nr:unnamed protein product [Adineta steineri]CAF3927130.1 unnamed protein product [Adineta steineri]